uniref:Uncharacterized protein n=1 Tax=Anguilla anguilla TaxID=7936 RepID=A0A0E9QYW3_ANGAN
MSTVCACVYNIQSGLLLDCSCKSKCAYEELNSS